MQEISEKNNDAIKEQMEEKTTPEEFVLDIKYNGELMSLDREKAIELAQKGMNYDHVHEELLRLRDDPDAAKLKELSKRAGTSTAELLDKLLEGETNPDMAADDRRSDAGRIAEFVSFFKSHPDIKGVAELPPEVMESIAMGKPLEEAFLISENRLLKSRLAEMENAQKSPGSLHAEGWADADEAFVNMLLAKL